MDFYLKQGFNVIPIGDASKQPIIDWKPYQTRKLTAAEIEQWFFSGATINIGIICGAVSENLVVLDFDEEKVYDKVKEYLPDTFKTRTGRGIHVYYRAEYAVRGFKIADLGMDIKGEGGYVLAPPSLHPSGIFYEELKTRHVEDEVKLIKGDFKQALLGWLKNYKDWKPEKFVEKVDVAKYMDGVKEGGRNEAAIRIASWFRARQMERVEAWEQIKLWNLKNKPPLDEGELERTWRSAYDREEPYDYNFGDIETSLREFWTAKDTQEASVLLNDPKILDYVRDQALGDVVGNVEFKTSLFLINLHYGNAHVLGDTATGKSHITDRIMRCFPLQTWFKITGVTDKAIRYLAEDIKHLYLAEWGAVGTKHNEESTAAYDIKILMSEGGLELLVVCKNETGMLKTQIVKTFVKNTIATTTNVELPKELVNRAWELGTEKRIAEVAQFKLAQRTRMEDRVDNEPQRRILRCAIDILETERPERFTTPYAKTLYKLFEPLTQRTRTTRDVDKLCDLIEASALLHYRQRPILERNGKKYLICLPQDFINAWTYGEEAIIGTLMELTERGKEAMKACEDIINQKKILTAGTLSTYADMSGATARDWLGKFSRFGLLGVVDRGKGGTKVYKLPTQTKGKDESITIDLPMRALYDAFEEWKKEYNIPAELLGDNRVSEKEKEITFHVRFPAFISAGYRLKLLPDEPEETEYPELKDKV
jgi:hypothetical protein